MTRPPINRSHMYMVPPCTIYTVEVFQDSRNVFAKKKLLSSSPFLLSSSPSLSSPHPPLSEFRRRHHPSLPKPRCRSPDTPLQPETPPNPEPPPESDMARVRARLRRHSGTQLGGGMTGNGEARARKGDDEARGGTVWLAGQPEGTEWKERGEER